MNETGSNGAYVKIQDAIDNASDGDTVFVYNGTYNENVVVNKTINLTGENRDTTIIDGGGKWDVVRITADYVNLTGFTITNSGSLPEKAGLRVESNNNIISNNNISSNYYYGIYLLSSSNINISGNKVFSNGWSGIQIYSSYNNTISNNNISLNSKGISLDTSAYNNIFYNIMRSNSADCIYLYYSSNNNILNNNISQFNGFGIYLYTSSNNNIVTNNRVFSSKWNGIFLGSSVTNLVKNNTLVENGIYIGGGTLLEWNSHTIENNTANGRPIYYYKNKDGITVPSDAAEVILANCSNFTIQGLNISKVDVGIELGYSNNNNISNNNISSNYGYGVLLFRSLNNMIYDNNISLNKLDGIHLTASYNNNIIDNNISSNNWGILIGSASNNNIISGNSILSNTKDGIWMWTSYNNNFFNNNIIFNSRNGIYLSSASNNIFSGNNISSNTAHGIYWFSYTKYNTISDNMVTSNGDNGIYLNFKSNYNTISGNTFFSNIDNGIYLDFSSINNIIYHNNFINNTNQASDSTNNSNLWDNDYPLGGNYWSDYTGIDLNSTPNQNVPPSDGIGDTPYVIDANSQDNFPLMEPYTSISFENYTILMEGWNLISIPLIQQNQNLQKVLEMIDGYYDAVQWQKPNDLDDPWKHHKVGKPFGNDLSEINETMGFWIHITHPGDTIFLYNGTQPTENQTIKLHEGWNLVGYPSLSNKSRSEALNNLLFDKDVDAIWSYDLANQKWEELGETDGFKIGKGYWIHAKTDCIWEVPL